jgi:magnesium chelatase family protein
MCGDAVLHRYARRVSGPLLDRFDLRVPVHRPAVDDLLVNEPGEPSSVVATRVAAARRLALDRQGCLNGALPAGRLDEVARVESSALALLRHELEHDRLSGRGYHRIRRVARTIADLRGGTDDRVDERDVVLALRFRASFTRSAPTGRVA